MLVRAKRYPSLGRALGLVLICLTLVGGGPLWAFARSWWAPVTRIVAVAPPASLEGSRLAEGLQAIAELDLKELQAIDPPRGYGRD